MTTQLTKKQVKTFSKIYTEKGSVYRITANVRHDDQCGNGHNAFSITGQIEVKSGNAWRDDCGGCIHSEIEKHFPNLAPFIKWHLVSTDGPMHYIANTTYHASNKDYRGLAKGEKRQLVNGKTKQKVWEMVVRDASGNEVSGGSGNWIDSDGKPSGKLSADYEPVWIIGEGKEPNLAAARSCAVWPDATLEQLQDKNGLAARLPALMAEFKRDVESLGFIY